jgi:hypothetical protein
MSTPLGVTLSRAWHQPFPRSTINSGQEPLARCTFRSTRPASPAARTSRRRCSGPTIDSIASQVTQAADILIDGSQDPSKSCDGVSIGVGFEAEIVQLGAIGDAPDDINPCDPDAGP